MPHLVSLEYETHRHLRIDPVQVEAAGATLNMAPVVLSEFLRLVIQYPIAFVKDKDTARFSCVALLGLHDGENLFVDEGAWTALYIPLQISRQPFFAGNASEDGSESGQFLICIDTDHAGVGATHGEALFDSAGQPSPYLAKARQDLADLLNGAAPTRQFIEHLARLKLLVQMRLEITFENMTSTEVRGLYTIDEAGLERLSADELASLHAQGHLGPAYTMLASLGHIYGMIDRVNQRHRRLAKKGVP